MKRYFGLIILSFFIVLLGAEAAIACKCMGRRQVAEGYQPCSSYWSADAVFVGTAETVTTDDAGRMRVAFSVEKGIRNVTADSVDVYTSSSTAACGYPFKKGEKYFVYARREPNGRYSEHLCGSTTRIGNADIDLEYSADVAGGASGSRIYGGVFEDRQPSIGDARTIEKVGGVEITIESTTDKKVGFKTSTNENGLYLFKEVPFGVYRVTARLPSGLRELFVRESDRKHLAVANQTGTRCGMSNFTVTRQGSIAGRLIEPNGKIPSQQFLSLLPVDETRAPLTRQTFEKFAVRESGKYSFDTVPAGNYLLAINPNNCPSANDGRQTMFFPGVAQRESARIISVAEGQQLDLADFRLLAMSEERWFFGTVLFSDGTPASNATVALVNADQATCMGYRREVKTDTAGRFRIKGFESYAYALRALTDKFQVRERRELYSELYPLPTSGGADNIRITLTGKR